MVRKRALVAVVVGVAALLAGGVAARADEPTLPACVELIDPPAQHGATAPSFEEAPPSSRAAGRVLETLAGVRASLRETRYEHSTLVRPRDGLYLWDCSGMAAWVMRRAAPQALATVGGERPVARDFYRAIAHAPTARARGGWMRVARLESARPGDVLSWVRPRDFPSHNTGHVAFVLAPPVKLAGRDDAYAVRIADATSFGHEADTRPEGSGGGYGEGTLLFLVDASGQGRAYGWFGTLSDAVIVTPVVVGRPVG